jgi:hypothetical protein
MIDFGCYACPNGQGFAFWNKQYINNGYVFTSEPFPPIRPRTAGMAHGFTFGFKHDMDNWRQAKNKYSSFALGYVGIGSEDLYSLAPAGKKRNFALPEELGACLRLSELGSGSGTSNSWGLDWQRQARFRCSTFSTIYMESTNNRVFHKIWNINEINWILGLTLHRLALTMTADINMGMRKIN